MKAFFRNHYGMIVIGLFVGLTLIHSRSNVLAEISVHPSENKIAQIKARRIGDWKVKMQELYRTLAEITTDTSSELRFNAPENKSRITLNAKKLADRAHDFAKKDFPADADPTIKIFTNLFQEEAQRAYWALKSGNRAYARGILNQISGYCIACHTRNNTGPNFSSLPLEPTSKHLDSIEQGRFYAATRQYDRALDLFQKIVGDSDAPLKRPLEWEQAIRYGLSIAVRVKKDPDQARALVERVIGSNRAPFYLKQDALRWKDSILKWKEEIPTRALTEAGLHTEAVHLLTQAKELQKYPMDRGADILYLRASAVIHELLQKAPEGRYAQEALLMAGMCYQVLRPVNLEDVHEIYYEACIKKSPHTPVSEVCYQRYEESTYAGYTGSGGVFLPEDLRLKLKRLEDLAHPESQTAPQLN